MPGKSGFDFNGASQSFNVLAEYLFGKVVFNFRSTFVHLTSYRLASDQHSHFLFPFHFQLINNYCSNSVEYNEGENGDDHTCFHTQGSG